MGDWLVGFSTGCFAQRAFSDSLQIIRDGGFTTIEICSFRPHLDYHDERQLEEAAASLQHYGFDAFSFHAPFGPNIDITALNEETRTNSQQELLKAAAAAHTLGVTHFVIHPGPESEHRPPTEEHMARLNNAAASLSRVAEYCARSKMTLVLENMLPHLMFGKISDLLYLCGEIKGGPVGVCLDTGHAFLGGMLSGIVDQVADRLTMVHANDSWGSRDDHLPPGKGTIDWPQLIEQLQRIRFAGAVILEVSRDHKSDAQILEEARESRSLFRSIV